MVLLLKTLGSLALFIFGLKIMSEGIQKFAGSRLRTMLSSMTEGRFTGVWTGFVTTALVQSSSATTVMIVSFVNAGLLNIRQAISVIMGANVGTTLTAWLVVILGFLIEDQAAVALSVLALGLPLLFSKRGSLPSAGEVLIGIAVLMIGIMFLKETVSDLGVRQNDALGMWLTKVSNAGFAGIVLFVFVGAALTVVAYSSAAVMVLTLVFIGEGLPYELAAAMIVGENLGTTITANLAALTGNIYAKRTALAHFLFNGFGVVWALLLFSLFVKLTGLMTHLLLPFGHPSEPGNYEAARWGLCMFHTSFNVLNAAILIWLVDAIMNVVNRVIPFKGEDIVFSLEYIGNGPLNTPELSLLEAYKETARFGKITSRMNVLLDKYMDATDEEERKTLLDKIGRYEDITDRIEIEIAKYLTALSRDEISQRAAERVRELLSVAGDLERMGDIYFQLAKKLEAKNNERVYFLPEQRQNIKRMLAKIEEAFKVMQDNLAVSPEKVDVQKAAGVEDEVNRLRDELKENHLKDIGSGAYPPQSGVYYSDLFLALEKIGDLIASVSYAAAGNPKAA